MEKLMPGQLNNLPKLTQLESSSTGISTQVFRACSLNHHTIHYLCDSQTVLLLALFFKKGIRLDVIYFIFTSNYALDFLICQFIKICLIFFKHYLS